MLRVRDKKRRALFITLAVTFIVFAASLSAVIYNGTNILTNIQNTSASRLAALDNEISDIKKRKAAEKKAQEEAERKAAEQKAASDAALSEQMQGKVVTPAGCAVSGSHGNPNAIDVVINKKRCFNPIDFVPSDLTSFNGYVVSAKIVADLTALFAAAASAGTPLSLTSAYRSYVNQVETYNTWVRANGSTAAADTVSARPGYSEHQTGFAVDLSAGGCSLECFSGSSQYQWMLANAAEFGFIQRYKTGFEAITGYSAETWHWRYVGRATAIEMKSKGIQTLEQLWNLPGGSY
jgi:zinc D-Ala-D-Ala carboxypeptidase